MEMAELAVSGDQVNDEFWRSLEARRDLEKLVIWGGPLSTEQLKPIGRMPWLTEVVLGEMPVDDGVFAHLRPLRDLACLNLAYTAIRGDFSPLQGAPLRDVRLEGCR